MDHTPVGRSVGADLRQNLNCSVPSRQGDGKESIIRSHGFAQQNMFLRLAEIDEKFQLGNRIILTVKISNATLLVF